MPNPTEFLKVGGKVFEVVDAAARDDISVLQTDLDVAEENITELQTKAETAEEDIQKLKLVSITPDGSLGIEGACADSKAVGDAIEQLRTETNTALDAISPESIGAVNLLNVANNLTTVEEGYVLDARQAYELNMLIQKRATTATYFAHFKASDWTIGDPHTQRVDVKGILKTDNPFADLDLSSAANNDAGVEMMAMWNLIGRISVEDGEAIAYCYQDVPTVDIDVILKVVR